MEYFVSIEDTCYHHWQLELLIESFKMHGLNDKLVVAIADNPEEKLVNFSANLKSMQRIFLHDNIGHKRGFLPLNKPYGLFAAITQGLVKFPLTVIDPDMILVNPVSAPVENIHFQLNPLFSLDYVQNHCDAKKYIQDLLKARQVEDINIKYWIPVGSVMIFNNVPNEFFSRVIEWAETLEYERRKKCNEDWWHTEKVAWALTLLEYNGRLSYSPRNDLEMAMRDSNKLHHFIHYTHGLPPVFSKFMYRFKPPHAFTMGDLFEVILSNNPTTCTNHMQQVVKSYLKTYPPTQKLANVREFKLQLPAKQETVASIIDN